MRFVPRPQAEIELKSARQAAVALLEIAEAAAAVGRETEHRKSGDYARAMKAKVHMSPIGWQGIFYNTDYKANWLERGTGPPVPTPPYHIMYKAALAVGLHPTFGV